MSGEKTLNKIIIRVWRGLVDHVELPASIKEYLIRDYDIEEELADFRSIPESQYPDLVIDVKGGMVTNVINNTAFDHVVIDND